MNERAQESQAPSVILEWAIWATLDRYKPVELILLKGHLLLEVAIEHALIGTGTSSPKEVKAMSFRRKLDELRYFTKADGLQSIALIRAQELNAMRNKLAHEAFHDANSEDLNIWASSVLFEITSHKFQKYTPRTKVTQAIAGLARIFYEHNAV